MRRLGLLILAISLVATVRLAVPGIAVACSCAMLDDPMRAAATDPATSVFTGVAGPQQAAGVAVRLTRWFHGEVPPSGVAVLDPAGFQDPFGGMCGTAAPGAGSEWIFATNRNSIGRYDVNLCTTHAPLDSEAGRELLADAQAVFGPPSVPSASDPPTGDTGPAVDGLPAIVPVGLAALFAIGAIGATLAIARRRPR